MDALDWTGLLALGFAAGLAGGLLGVVVANAVSQRVPELAFAAVQLLFVWQLAKKAGLR